MPDDTQAKLQRVKQLIRSGESLEAKQLLASLIKTDPRNADAWFLASLLAPNADEQRKLLQRALNFDPAHPDAQNALADLDKPEEDPIGQLLATSSQPATPLQAPRKAQRPQTPQTSQMLFGLGVGTALILLVVVLLLIAVRLQSVQTADVTLTAPVLTPNSISLTNSPSVTSPTPTAQASPTVSLSPTGEPSSTTTQDASQLLPPDTIFNMQLLPEHATQRMGLGFISTAVVSGDGSSFYLATKAGLYAIRTDTLEYLWAHIPSAVISSIALSVDDKVLAIGMENGGVEIVDTATGAVVRQFMLSEGNSIDALTLSPNQEMVAAASLDEPVLTLWNITNGELVTSIAPANEEYATTLAFSPDSARITGATTDYSLQTWDIATGEVLQLANRIGEFHSIAYSPSGQSIAAGAEGMILILNSDTGQPVAQWNGHQNFVTSLHLVDDTTLITGSLDGTIAEWTVGSEMPTLVMVLEPPGEDPTSAKVAGLAISSNGTRSVAWIREKQLKVWNLDTETVLYDLRQEFLSFPTQISISPDGSVLAVSKDNLRVGLWNVTNRQLISVFEDGNSVRDLQFLSDGTVLVQNSRGLFTFWEPLQPAPLRQIELPGDNNFDQFAVSADEKWLVTFHWSDEITLVNLETGFTAEHIYLDPQRDGIYDVYYRPHSEFLSDNRIVLNQRDEQVITFWDWNVENGVTSVASGNAFAASPNTSLIVVGGRSGWQIIDSSNGEVVNSFSIPSELSDGIWEMAFSPRGDFIAATNRSGLILLLDAETGATAAEFRGHLAPVYDLLFSPDGSHLFSVSADETIINWMVP